MRHPKLSNRRYFEQVNMGIKRTKGIYKTLMIFLESQSSRFLSKWKFAFALSMVFAEKSAHILCCFWNTNHLQELKEESKVS